jgi:hypothetical protein
MFKILIVGSLIFYCFFTVNEDDISLSVYVKNKSMFSKRFIITATLKVQDEIVTSLKMIGKVGSRFYKNKCFFNIVTSKIVIDLSMVTESPIIHHFLNPEIKNIDIQIQTEAEKMPRESIGILLDTFEMENGQFSYKSLDSLKSLRTSMCKIVEDDFKIKSLKNKCVYEINGELF